MKSLSNVFDCVSVCVIVCICVCMCVSNLFNGFGERENKMELARAAIIHTKNVYIKCEIN